ncbi:MAG: DUF5688 family protein [Clostridia bacterium]|nr:DUF5688 family protein [Clostridia bacterium]
MSIMSYEEFKERIKNEILDYLPEFAEEGEVRIGIVNKVNQKLEALQIFPGGEKSNTISPNVYLEHVYDRYKKCSDMEETLEKTAEIIREGFKNVKNLGPADFKMDPDSIVFMLMNRAKNEEYLRRIPHRDVLDLALVYRMIFSTGSNGLVSAVIGKAQMEELGLNEEELYNLALKNSKKIFPEKMRRVGEMLADMLNLGAARPGLPGSDNFDEEMKMPLYVLSNSAGINGASAMLYEEVLEKCVSEIGDNVYILPSSIHEVLLLPEKSGNPEDLREIVKEVNASHVALNEILSDEVYFYKKGSGKLQIA